MRLTETKIKALKPAERMKRHSDGNGLYLQVDPKGGKYWRFRYLFTGKEKMLALGTYPEVSLAEARDKCNEARKTVAAGIDPGQKKKEAKRLAAFKAENTFQAVAKEWFETKKSAWSDDHADRIWRRLELHILPEIGKMPIAEVSALDILDAIREVEGRGNTEMSRRLLQTCTTVLRYAVVTKRITYNPANDLRGALKPHKAKHYPTITANEISDFLKKLETARTSEQNKLAVRLMMHTFVRTIELRRARWEDVDFSAKEWRLPPETTKTKVLHIVPLAKQTIELLNELKSLTGGNGLLFPPQMRCRHPLMSENTINQLIKRMGYKGKLVGHGFRALASTTLHEMGYSSDVIEKQLAHKITNQVKAAYNHAQYLSQRKAMMQDWADLIERAARGEAIVLGDADREAA